MKIAGSVVIVTGASSGIGEATARLFAQKGAKVAIVARSKERLEQIAQELPDSLPVVVDMTKKEDIIAMIQTVKDHFGRIDILINNAGQGYDALVEHINIEKFHHIFDLNLVGPITAMQQVIPIMKKQGEGTIVNVSSGTALMILPSMGAYASLKQALAKISLTAREELKKDNIHVCVIYPYITQTNFEKNTLKDFAEEQTAEINDNYQLPAADSPHFVSEKIIEGIVKNQAEIFVHGWMKHP